MSKTKLDIYDGLFAVAAVAFVLGLYLLSPIGCLLVISGGVMVGIMAARL